MGSGEPTPAARGLLVTLARAAGLGALATATMASGPCGSCDEEQDATYSIEQLNHERDVGRRTPAIPATPDLVTTAEGWDGATCPNLEQEIAILRLSGKTPVRGELTVRSDGSCNYHKDEMCYGGRPFLVHGKARVADVLFTEALSPLARGWLDDGLMEHASIAAFARLSLQLLALGAPAELVAGAQRASLDELRHSDFCFAMASRHAGETLAPGAIAIQGALDDLSLAALIECNLREGCIGETMAAQRLRKRAELATEPGLAQSLLEIADDETRHAELAFAILRWCLQQAPELTREITARVLAKGGPATTEPGGDPLHERDAQTWQHVLAPLLSAVA